MSVHISIHKYKVSKLCDDLENKLKNVDLNGRLPARQFLSEYMPYFGEVDGGNFYTLWNDYYEDYNAACEFMIFVGAYYGSESVWFDGYESPVSAANAGEVWDEVFGTEIPTSEG